MIKQVFEDGIIQDHISEKNASDFYSESCFGIVFPEIESLKSYRDKLNGYDFSEIPLIVGPLVLRVVSYKSDD